MIAQSAEVKSKSKVVGTAEYPKYDSVQEGVDDIGAEGVLELINAQVRTNAMNSIRAQAVGKPSKTMLRKQAMGRISMEELQANAGNPDALEDLVLKYMAEIESELASAAPTEAEVQAEDDSEVEAAAE